MRQLILTVVVAAASSMQFAWAGDWPEKAVRIVVPFPAGGATDAPARMLGEKLSELWRQPVIVENRPGAGGSLGAAEVARSAPDGYTLLFPSGAVMTVNQFVYAKPIYDPERDFTPVTNVVSAPQILVVPAASPFKSIKELIAFARANPGKLTFAHAGIGSQSHLANEYFLQEAKIDAVGVPYKGDPPAVSDLIGGTVDYSVINLGAAIGQVKGGRLRALGVTRKGEIPQLPGVPPIASVLPGFENSGWFGIVAPTGVPSRVIQKIYKDTRSLLQNAELRGRLTDLGYTIVGNTPQEMGEAMTLERKRWSRVVDERNIGQVQ